MPVTEAPSRDPEGNGLARTSAPRLRFGTADALVQFWRAKWLMLLVFVPVFSLGLAAALSRPDLYEARTRLIVTGASVSGPKEPNQRRAATSPRPITPAAARAHLQGGRRRSTQSSTPNALRGWPRPRAKRRRAPRLLVASR